MTASLIVAGYEVIANGVASPWKLATLGWVKGDALPDQAEIVNRILDGEAVTGKRTQNRHPRIPLWVTGANALDLAANINALWQAVDQDTFTVQWTPEGGLPIVFDCYRARVMRPNNQNLAEQGVTALMIECDAMPFGRSPTAQSVVAVTSTQIDSYDTAPTGATLSTADKVEGTGSAVLPGDSGTVSRTFAAKDLSADTSATIWERMTQAGGGGIADYSLHLTLTLSSAGGSTAYPMRAFGGLAPATGSGPWYLRSLPFAGGTVASGAGVNLAAVTGYSLAYAYSYAFGIPPTGTLTRRIDDLRGAGATSTLIGPTTHAAVLAVPVSVGSARTPANLAVTNGSTFSAFVLHSPPIDQDDQAQILSSLSGASTDQTVAIAALNSGFRGTYGVYLGVSTVGSGATVVVTITQKEGATTVATKALTKTYTGGPHVVPVGEVTLPLVDIPSDNAATSYTVRVQITSGSDRYTELMLLDTRGQAVFTDTDTAAAVAAAYVDEPSALQSGPPVYGSATDRTAAYGILGNCVVTGGPILLEPGTNKLLAWVSASAPALAATYFPRWLDERSS